jgi:hypothetical protein
MEFVEIFMAKMIVMDLDGILLNSDNKTRRKYHHRRRIKRDNKENR